MARRTPQRSKPPVVRDGHSSLSISDHGDDDAGDEEEYEDEEEEEEDRGDKVGGDGDDEGDEEDPDGDEGDDEDEEEEEDEDEDEDEEEEEEEEEEEDEEELSAEDLEALANEGMVPLARLNQVLDQNRQLNDQVIALLKGGVKAGGTGGGDEPPPFDLKAKIAARTKALVDGDEEAANALDLEIEDYRQAVAEEKAAQRVAAALQAQATTNAVASVRKAFPALDPESRKFNEETLDIVRATANLFQSKGMTAAEAIIKAAKRVLGEPAGGGDGTKPPKSGKKAAKAAAARDAQQRARDGKDARTQQQRLKDLARSKRIPPRTAGGGVPNRNSVRETDDDDASTVTEGRFRRMSDQEKREARGDFVGSGRRRRGRG